MATNITILGPLPETFANATSPLSLSPGSYRNGCRNTYPVHRATVAGAGLGFRRKSGSSSAQTAGEAKTTKLVFL